MRPLAATAPIADGVRGALDASFEAIYDGELAWVHRTLRRLGARPADLEDLCHDVFVAVYRALDRFDHDRPLRPWLFGIAFRVVSDYRSRARYSREHASDMLDETPAAGADPEAALAGSQARTLLLRALDALPLDQRAVFVAAEIDETPIPELAIALGTSVNTLYSRLRLARARVASAVQSFANDGGRR